VVSDVTGSAMTGYGVVMVVAVVVAVMDTVFVDVAAGGCYP
jgi:hypothetical protein